jgi:hypothetical protein
MRSSNGSPEVRRLHTRLNAEQRVANDLVHQVVLAPEMAVQR